MKEDILEQPAFRRKIKALTGSDEFVYVTAVTRLIGDRAIWVNYQPFRSTIGAELELITLSEMVDTVLGKTTTTVANSELGRMIQLLKAAGRFGDLDT